MMMRFWLASRRMMSNRLGGASWGTLVLGAVCMLLAGALGPVRSARAQDCNGNSVNDLVDIAEGTSQDCNANSVPDECGEIVAIYVDRSVLVSGDGTTWGEAYKELFEALPDAEARTGIGQVVEVWVAQNRYEPTNGNDRTTSFGLLNCVSILGGFAGTETSSDQRDPTSNVTTLSGDLGNNDSGFSSNDENSYHVVTGGGTDATAVLDGFTISGGNADGTGANGDGGGMLNVNGNPTLAQCIFTFNSAKAGGAMVNITSSPSLTDCEFVQNTANNGGGMSNRNSSRPKLTRCLFTGNTTLSWGGAMLNDNSFPVLHDCQFVSNSASDSGGAIRNQTNSIPELFDCTFTGNSAPTGGAVNTIVGSDIEMTRCLFQDNTATSRGGALFAFGSSPVLVNCIFLRNRGNTTGADGGGAYLDGGNAELTNCLFSGNTAGDDGGAVYSTLGDPTITNCTFSQNQANFGGIGGLGGGIFNTGGGNPVVANCVLWGNSDSGSTVVTAQFHVFSGTPAVTFSCIQDTNPSDASIPFGGAANGNIDDDPLFLDPAGVDTTPGTADDDLRPGDGSPCLDAGDNAALPSDKTDLDGDLVTAEAVPLDLDLNPRLQDYLEPGDIAAVAPVADMGAYERLRDCNINGTADLTEIAQGTSADCDTNLIPDECDPDFDCNVNSVQDICDVAAGTSLDCNNDRVPDECQTSGNDCNSNTIPDECETDCNTNNIPDDCDIVGGTSIDCAPGNGIPDECEPDCDGNNTADSCDISAGAPDCPGGVGNGIPDVCEPDCNGNNVADTCDIELGTSQDCNANEIPDSCDPQDDCQPNSFQDICDIALGTSEDCNSDAIPDDCQLVNNDCNDNLVPDECELAANDCNSNGVLDECDIASGTSIDCPGGLGNGIPDECEVDCDGLGVADSCEIDSGLGDDCNGNAILDLCDVDDGTSEDCDGNFVPDECQIEGSDCNGNGIIDICDVIGGTSEDCTFNGIPDECERDCDVSGVADVCEIAFGTAQDCNFNGFPDDCDIGAGGVLLDVTFEDGFPIGWGTTAAEVWHVTDQCGTTGDCAPTKWAYFGIDGDQQPQCNFDTGAPISDSLFSSAVFIPQNASEVTLIYCSAYGGQGGVSPGGFDSAWLAVNGVIVDDVSQDGEHLTWETRVVDLSDFIGQVIGLSFNFDSVDGVLNDGLGWQISQIEISFSGLDCDGNGSPDDCDISECSAGDPVCDDCNSNDVPDTCDLDQLGKVRLFDDFPVDTIDSLNWPVALGTSFSSVEFVSSPFSLILDADDRIESASLILLGVPLPPAAGADLSLFWKSSATLGSNLLDIDYWDGAGWMNLAKVSGGANPPEFQELIVPLPAGALHSVFKLRIRSLGSGGGQWFIDDVRLVSVSADCNSDSVPDECEPDCDGDGVADSCVIATCPGDGSDPACQDCNGTDVPDECDILFGTSDDCNCNGIPDNCDIAADPGIDSNGDQIPDVCDNDADGDAVSDLCDQCSGNDDSLDADGDAVPDGCDNCVNDFNPDQSDCDGNQTGDACDTEPDADGDAVADACEACPGFDDLQDADGDNVPDACDICSGFDDLEDADGDNVPDGCDNCVAVANSDQKDCNGDGQGDVCDTDVGEGDPDGDGICDGLDACEDSDGDGFGDPGTDISGCAGSTTLFDNCPLEPTRVDPDEPGTELTCDDEIDNDCDALTDIEDSDCPCICADFEDATPDGVVNLLDFAQFSLCFLEPSSTPGCRCMDMNLDGTVNLFDFGLFAGVFGMGSANSPPNCL